MIRIRDIALPPEHNVNQLQFEAAQLLKVPASKIRALKLVKRSVDARKKPDVKIIYTIDVAIDGNEEKIIRKSGRVSAAAAIAGDILGIRPIFTLIDGESKVIKKARGDKMVLSSIVTEMKARMEAYLAEYGPRA